MSLFHINYDCHEGALVMRKKDGEVYMVRGNVSLWDMTAVLVPYEKLYNEFAPVDESVEIVCVKPRQFKEEYLLLDEGKARLSDTFKQGLSNISNGRPPVT